MFATNLIAFVLLAASSLSAQAQTSGGDALAARASEHGGHHHNNAFEDSPAPLASGSGGARKRSERAVIPLTLGLVQVDPARLPSGMMACPVTAMAAFKAANAEVPLARQTARSDWNRYL